MKVCVTFICITAAFFCVCIMHLSTVGSVLCTAKPVFCLSLTICWSTCGLRSISHFFTSGSWSMSTLHCGGILRIQVATSTFQHKPSVAQPSLCHCLSYCLSDIVTQACSDASSVNEETSHRRAGEVTGMQILLCNCWNKQCEIESAHACT